MTLFRNNNRTLSSFTCICLLLAMLAVPVFSEAQAFLVLQKNGMTKGRKMLPGDDLHFQIKGQNDFHFSAISRIHDSIVVFSNGMQLTAGEIQKIKQGRTMVRILGGFAFIAGVGYVSLDVVNNLINNIGPVFSTETLIVSGILIGTAIVCRQFSTRTLTLGKQWKLVVVDYQNPPPLK